MGWDRVVGQDRAVATLKHAIASGRIGHAYLFFGAPGAGKRAAALAFAQALLCEHGGPEPCGECSGCSKAIRGIHADVRVHIPFPGKEMPTDLPKRRELLALDPYARVDFTSRPSLSNAADTSNKQTRYPIDYVRDELIRLQSFRPVEGRFKVTIVTEAHLLGAQGSNALLKSLEEPPDQTVNILLTDRPDLLLPTVISRCEQVRFEQIDAELIAGELGARGTPADVAGVIARMADGSLTRAMDLADDPDLAARRAFVVEFMRAAYTGRPGRLSELITTMTSEGREHLKRTFGSLLDWVRDLMLFAETGDAERIVNVDQASTISDFCGALPDADVPAMVGLIEQAILLAERNVNAKLLSAVLAQKLGRAMHGRDPGPLFEPLVATAMT
jgi:DNA polymerase-3 subunit delta'